MHRGSRRYRLRASRTARGLGSLVLLAVMVFMPSVVMADDFPGPGEDNSGNDTHTDANTTDDEIDGGDGEDTLDGSGGNDTITGGDGNDEVDGGDGDDGLGGDNLGSSGSLPPSSTGSDDIAGGVGNDTIYGDGALDSSTAEDTIHGDNRDGSGDGNDTIVGDSSASGTNVTVHGGADEVFGDGGNDIVHGDGTAHGTLTAMLLGGGDIVSGGLGDDAQVLGDGQASSNGTAHLIGGNDSVDGGEGNDVWVHGDGLADCYGCAAFSATLDGGDDSVNGGDGNDNQVWGDGYTEGSNDSTLNGGADTVSGGEGDDGVFGDGFAYGGIVTLLTGGEDLVDGGDGNDHVYGDGLAESDQLSGSVTLAGGIDTVLGGIGDDFIWGDGVVTCAAVCTLLGGDDSNITGGDGNDTIDGDGNVIGPEGHLTGGIDTIDGGDGADTIEGDGTVQVSNGGTGTLTGGADEINSGAGDDIIRGDGSFFALAGGTATLTGGDDVINAGAGNDLIYGEGTAEAGLITSMVGGNDIIDGAAGNDTIFGQSGSDILLGGEGDDTLDGGVGSDFLCGGSGADVVKGGAGADLQCAVDDAITVKASGGTINVALNEELDDVDAADRDGRRFEIISISGSIKAVIDSATGLLTIFSADSDGQIRYRVFQVGGGFESFASVFVTLMAESREEDPERESDPEPSADPAPSIGVIVPVADPVDPAVPDNPDPVGPAAKDATGQVDGEGEAGAGALGSMGEAVADLMHSEFAPAAQVTLATTLMMAVTGGLGVSSASLANARPGSSGGSKGESAPNRSDGTSDGVYIDFSSGEGPGDRSFTWRFPGHKWLDKASVVLPVSIAPHSPLLGRLAVDGSELRAMFGTLWLVLPTFGAVLGAMAAASSGGVALPPPLWILVAGAILTTFDALAGAIASAVYIGAGLATGILWNPQSPDFVHSLLVYSGVAFLWTSIPLIGSAIRPFRRLGKGSFRHAWDVAADLSIAALLCAWVTRGLFGAMDNFAGQPTGIGAYADKAALVVLACVALRVMTEHVTTRLYKRRLRAVETTEDFPEPTLVASFTGIAIRTALFSFIGHAFIGSSWQWWVGTLLYCVPQVLAALDARFDQNKIIQKFLPRGIVALFILLLAGAGLLKLATMHSQSPLETMQWVFVLLAIPPLLLAVLERFTPEDDKKRRTGWTAEILGLGVVVASTWLAFNGWNL